MLNYCQALLLFFSGRELLLRMEVVLFVAIFKCKNALRLESICLLLGLLVFHERLLISFFVKILILGRLLSFLRTALSLSH